MNPPTVQSHHVQSVCGSGHSAVSLIKRINYLGFKCFAMTRGFNESQFTDFKKNDHPAFRAMPIHSWPNLWQLVP